MRKGRKVHILEEGRYRTQDEGRPELLKSAGYEFVLASAKALLWSLLTRHPCSRPIRHDRSRIHQFHFRAAAVVVRAQGDKLTAADVTRKCGITCCAWALGRNRAACLFPPREAADLRDIAAAAALLPVSGQKRTRRPLINDLTFTTQLYLCPLPGAASYSADYRDRWCAHPWATNHRRFDGYGLGKLGFTHRPLFILARS